MLKNLCLLLIVLVALSCAVPAQAPAMAANSKEADNLGEELDEYLSRSAALGFSGAVLLAQNGKIVLKKGYGFADRKRRIPFSPSTVYNLESTTKQFIAAGILRLEEQGKLKTTDLLTKYFDGVPEDKKEITLHHLLTHTAGLSGTSGDDFEVIERDAVVRRILDSKLRSMPGTKWAYSNPGYALLAVVIEKVSGQPHEKFIREQFWIPAGMTDTGYTIPEPKRGRLAHSYNLLEDMGTPLDHPYAPDGPWWNYRGGGGILSTVEDMYRWHLALKRGAVLSAESQRKAITPYALTTRPQTHYGYAWLRENYESYQEVLWRDVKIEDEREYLKQIWQPRLKPFGAFKNAEPIGTGKADNSQVLYVLLNFERGSQLVRFHRNDEGRFFMNTDPVPFLPPLYRFVPVSKTDFAGYNFAAGTEVNISFRKDKNGNISGLTVRGQRGDVFLKKLK